MYELRLNDGTKMKTDGAGAAEGYLWIYGLQLSIAEAAAVFDDPGKTAKMTVYYQQDLPESVFEGYTALTVIQRDGDGIKVCMKKEERNNG